MTGEAGRSPLSPLTLVEQMKAVGWVCDSMTARHARMRWPVETEILLNGRGLVLYVPLDLEDVDYSDDLNYLMETFAAVKRASAMIDELSVRSSAELRS